MWLWCDTVTLCFSYENQVKVLRDKLKTKETDESTDMTKVKQALLQLEKKGDELVKKQMDIEKKEKVSMKYTSSSHVLDIIVF